MDAKKELTEVTALIRLHEGRLKRAKDANTRAVETAKLGTLNQYAAELRIMARGTSFISLGYIPVPNAGVIDQTKIMFIAPLAMFAIFLITGDTVWAAVMFLLTVVLIVLS